MNDLNATTGLYAARPVVYLDGQPDSDLTSGLLSMVVEETTEGLYRGEFGFGNWGSMSGDVGYLYFDRSKLDFGRTIGVKIGDTDTEATVFEGRIMGLEANYPSKRPPEILVLAEDRFQDLRMGRRTRVFEDVSDSDVFARVASEHGLSSDIDVDGPTHRVLAQVNASDLAFLRDRARAVDAEVWLESDTLHAQARSRRLHEDVTMTYGQRLREFSVLADLAKQRTSLSVSGWDVGAKESIDHEATESVIQPELRGDESGPSILSSIGQRKERVVHTVPHSTQEARTVAESRYRTVCRRFVQGVGLAEGDGRIRVGSTVDLAGLGPLFTGRYYAVEVRHTLDDMNGYRTQFRVERPGIGSA